MVVVIFFCATVHYSQVPRHQQCRHEGIRPAVHWVRLRRRARDWWNRWTVRWVPLRRWRNACRISTTTLDWYDVMRYILYAQKLAYSPFSGTAQVSRYQKGKTNLDFAEARDSEWQWHQLGHMQVCTSLQTDNHTSTPPPLLLLLHPFNGLCSI